MDFHDRLKMARTNAGLTQSMLAQHLGCDVVQIARYESGKRRPEVHRLAKIAVHLGVRADWLLTGHVVPEEGRQWRKCLLLFGSTL